MFSGALDLFAGLLWWIVIIVVILLVGILALWIAKQRKMKIIFFEIINTGNGKIWLKKSKCGWVGTNHYLRGLITTGPRQVLTTSDGREIMNGSARYFHSFNGKPCIICKRKDDDPKILVPIEKVMIDGEDMIAEIAPASYIEAAVNLYNRDKREIQGWWEKNAVYVMFAGVMLFAFISIVVVARMISDGQASIADQMKTIGSSCGAILASSAP